MKTCKNCIFLREDHTCLLIVGQKVDVEKDACPKHQSTSYQCEICGAKMIKQAVIFEIKNGDSIRLVCESCHRASGTCGRCKYAGQCVFETDPSPIPKLIEKRIQQGPMLTVTQIRNPERIEITCKKSCPCYDPENECLKQFNTCGKCEDI